MTEFQKTESPKNNKVVTNQNYWDVLKAPLNKRNKEQFIYTYTLNTRLSKLNFYMYKKKFIINK